MWDLVALGRISIHAPREGGDCRKNEPHGQQQPISIHAPREGGDC